MAETDDQRTDAVDPIRGGAPPPRVEPTARHLRVLFNGETIAETRRAYRVLETGHLPVYYIPPEDVRVEYLSRTPRSTLCEWKGTAAYYAITVGDRTAADAAWCYPDPTPAFTAIARHLAFYVGKVDACFADGIAVEAEPGDYYGGWITPDLVSPFKGELANSGG